MRLFAAIPLADEARDRLAALQSGLPEKPRVPWENFHVTLGFFGDVDPHREADLDAALTKIRFQAFDLTMDGVDAFGGDKPRHLYAAVAPSAPLLTLQASVIRAARDAGIRTEARRYVPHVTLARLGGRHVDERLLRWLSGAGAFRAGPFRIAGFELLSSSLGSGPPHYALRRRYDARG